MFLKDVPSAAQGSLRFPMARRLGREGSLQTVNGTLQPDLQVAGGSLLRLRIVNESSARLYRLALEDHPLHLIATDGGGISAPLALDELLLAPGERAEVLVQANRGGGRYRLLNLPYGRFEAWAWAWAGLGWKDEARTAEVRAFPPGRRTHHPGHYQLRKWRSAGSPARTTGAGAAPSLSPPEPHLHPGPRHGAGLRHGDGDGDGNELPDQRARLCPRPGGHPGAPGDHRRLDPAQHRRDGSPVSRARESLPGAEPQRPGRNPARLEGHRAGARR